MQLSILFVLSAIAQGPKSQCNGQAMSTTGYAYALGLTLEY
ncbi:hypothetical protein [Nostoc edaphicum]|nr:hypothetical protein [Nostoc edaphicum]